MSNKRNPLNINTVIQENKSYSHVLKVEKMDEIQLQTFVKDYVEGCIFTTYTLVHYKFPLHPLLGDIFDPIKKGALSKMDKFEFRSIGHIYEYFVLEDPYEHVVYDSLELPVFRSFRLIHKNDWDKAKLLMKAFRSIHDNNKLVVDLNEPESNSKNRALYTLI